jgi:hypothetical protein
MQFGSIHKDGRSARRAAQALIRAGIEPSRVRIVRPRAGRPTEPTTTAPARATLAERARDAAMGAGSGVACGILACTVLAIARVRCVVEDPFGAMIAVVCAAALSGACAALFGHGREPDHAPRVRSRMRGWAVVVDVRDAEQRALAALALTRTA